MVSASQSRASAKTGPATKARGAAGETATGMQNTRIRRQTPVCKKRPLPPLQTQTAPFLYLHSLYPRFSSMQLDRKTHFSATKWVRVAPPPQRRTCTTLTSICFEAYHANAAAFPSRDPTAGSRPAARSRFLWYVSRHRCTKRPWLCPCSRGAALVEIFG